MQLRTMLVVRGCGVFTAASFVVLNACSEEMTGADGTSGMSDVPGRVQDDDCQKTPVATPRRVRLLSRGEYLSVAANLLGPTVHDLKDLVPEDVRIRGVANPADAVSVTPGRLDGYATFAEKAAAAADVAALAPCTTGQSVDDCAATFVRQSGRRGFGRPLDEAEVARFTEVFRVGAEGQDYPAGIRLVIETLLQSPGFLYAPELGEGDPPAGDQSVPLTDHELASRLSFTLGGTRPDDQLLEAADRGELRDPAQLRLQAERILAQPVATTRLRDLMFGWLELNDLGSVQKDDVLYPEFTPDVRAAMVEEAERFVDQVLWRGSGTLPELFTTTDRYVPAALQPIYGQDPDPGRRQGILSLAGPLAALSAPQHSRPVARGLFVLQRLLCQELPPPPQGVAMRPIDAGDATRTTREKYAQHSSDPSCRGCHQLFDPIGFGLEQMDAVGRFRATEAGLPVDSSGQLIGSDKDGPFTGPAELDQRLAGSATMRNCFAGQVFRFVEIRTESAADRCERQWIREELGRNGGRIRELLTTIVGRPSFSLRRVER
jgi:hypothetical protein